MPSARPRTLAASRLTASERRVVVAAGRKTCRHCSKEKPLGDFSRCKNKKTGNWWHRGICRCCASSYTSGWRDKHPDRCKAYRENSKAREASVRKLFWKLSGQNVDIARRALCDKPPNLGSELERLAYFRGFFAGAKHTAQEGERFTRLQDLAHRIASERSMKAEIGYEEAISAAYEGLLSFVRKRRPFDSEEAERKYAATVIRGSIIDYKRAHGPRDKNGKIRFQRPIGQSGEDNPIEPASQDAPRDEIATLLDHPDLDLQPRHKRILEGLASGKTQVEIGKELKVTGSRVSEIIRDLRERHGERLRQLLQPV